MIRCRLRAFICAAFLTMMGRWGIEVVWAAEAVEEAFADRTTRPTTLLPIRARGKEFQIQPPAHAFASSKEVPLMRGQRFHLQSAVETLEDEKR